MERPEDIRAPNPLKGEYIAIAIIVIFHMVGIIGLSIASLRPYFLAFVPWHLLIMFAILIFNHRYIDEKFILFAAVIFMLGYAAEWIGVHTHWLFGDYNYGNTLGVKVSDVPLIIGVNWFLLTYSTGVLMQRPRLKSAAARVLLGTILLIVLDLLIEPIAVRFDYWHWANHGIPLTNYLCWFLVSGVMLMIFEVFRFKKQGIVAPVFLICQFIFFLILLIGEILK
jgi:putative membrane protein